MFATVLIAGALALAQTDKWELKVPMGSKASPTFSVTVNVEMQGEEHEATLDLHIEMLDNPENHPLAGTASWTNLVVDGGTAMEDLTWDVKFSPNGAVIDAKSDMGDGVRRMLNAMMFSYPAKPVEVGDTWVETVKAGTDKSDQSVTLEFKVEAIEKVGDVETMRITEKLTELGADAMSGSGIWWVDRSGGVEKFEMRVKNWVVPMAGEDLMNAKIRGFRKKS